jgi:hypothetical protein
VLTQVLYKHEHIFKICDENIMPYYRFTKLPKSKQTKTRKYAVLSFKTHKSKTPTRIVSYHKSKHTAMKKITKLGD